MRREWPSRRSTHKNQKVPGFIPNVSPDHHHRAIYYVPAPTLRGDIAGCQTSRVRSTRPRAYVAAFFFAFGFTAFGVGCGSGLPSIDDSRPAVKV